MAVQYTYMIYDEVYTECVQPQLSAEHCTVSFRNSFTISANWLVRCETCLFTGLVIIIKTNTQLISYIALEVEAHSFKHSTNKIYLSSSHQLIIEPVWCKCCYKQCMTFISTYTLHCLHY